MSSIRDFYLRQNTDPAFRPDQFEVYDELESALQQIKMTLFTRKGEVLGEPDFGIDIEKYLFEFNLDPISLSRDADSQLTKYVSEAKRRSISVKPAVYSDDKANRDIFVLLVDVPEIKSTLSIFYD